MSQPKMAALTLRTQDKRPLTAIEQAFLQSGRPLRWYARRLCEKGVSTRTLANFEATLRGYMRNGSAPFRLAERFIRLLGLPVESPIHDLLLKPKLCWPTWAHQGATGTPGKNVSLAATNRAGIAARPVPQKSTSTRPVPQRPVRIEPRRITVLEVI